MSSIAIASPPLTVKSKTDLITAKMQPKSLLNQRIPDALLIEIFAFSSPKEIVTLRQVCTHWYVNSKPERIWRQIAKSYAFTPKIEQPTEVQVKALHATIANTYPRELIETVGGIKKIANLPVAKPPQADVNGYNCKEAVIEGHMIAKGYFLEEGKRTPFIAFRYVRQLNNEQLSGVIVLWQRYAKMPNLWLCQDTGGVTKLSGQSLSYPNQKGWMQKLLKGERCAALKGEDAKAAESIDTAPIYRLGSP